MRFLFVNQTFFPDLSATSQFLSEISKTLVQRGHEVSVLTSRRGFIRKNECYPASETWEGVKVHRVSGCRLTQRKRSKILRTIEALFQSLAFLRELRRARDFDVVVIMTSPAFLSLIGALGLKRDAYKRIHWIMDLNPDQAIAAGWVPSVIKPIAFAISKLALHCYDRVLVLDSFMKDRLVSRGVSAERISILPLWCPNKTLRPIAKTENHFRNAQPWRDAFVVMYSGNFSLCHPFETLLRAASLVQSDSSIHFVFIGEGPRKSEIEAWKREQALDNISIMSYVEESELAFSLSAADLHVVILGEQYVGIVHPSKVYGILSVGCPFVFIGPKDSYLGELAEKAPGCVQIEHGAVSELASELQARASNPVAESIPSELTKLSRQFDISATISELLTLSSGSTSA